MQNNKFSKGMEIVLKKLCDAVGANYDEVDFKEKEWFMKYEWTYADQDKFKKWLTEKIMNDKEICKAICGDDRLIKSVKLANKIADGFILQCGWKTKRTEQNYKNE